MNEPIVSQHDRNILFLSKWGGESLAEIKAISGGTFFREKPDGIEFDIALDRRPRSNRFDYQIRRKNLAFYYQPPLSPAEIERGNIRPENVIGSYAVYHPTRTGHNLNEGRNYGCGKAFHVFRPKAIDKNGEESWAGLRLSKGILSVIVDPLFLRKAAYPVIVDPEFGNHSDGATGWTGSADYLSGFVFPLTESGQPVSLFARCYRTGGGNAKVGIYDTASPSDRKGHTASTAMPETVGWMEATVLNPESMSAGDHRLCIVWESTNSIIRYDTTTDWTSYIVHTFANELPASVSSWTQYQQYKISIYCVYTAGSGPDVTRPLTGVCG